MLLFHTNLTCKSFSESKKEELGISATPALKWNIYFCNFIVKQKCKKRPGEHVIAHLLSIQNSTSLELASNDWKIWHKIITSLSNISCNKKVHLRFISIHKIHRLQENQFISLPPKICSSLIPSHQLYTQTDSCFDAFFQILYSFSTCNTNSLQIFVTEKGNSREDVPVIWDENIISL